MGIKPEAKKNEQKKAFISFTDCLILFNLYLVRLSCNKNQKEFNKKMNRHLKNVILQLFCLTAIISLFSCSNSLKHIEWTVIGDVPENAKFVFGIKAPNRNIHYETLIINKTKTLNDESTNRTG